MGKIILLAENEEIHHRLISDFFEPKGNLVLWYTSGIKAVKDIENGLRYHLALVDRELDGSVYGGDDVVSAHKKFLPEVPIYTYSCVDLPMKGTDGAIDKAMDFGDRVEKIERILENV